MTTTPKRRRVGAVTLVAGAAFLALSAFAPSAQAGVDAFPPVFGPGYDSYLNENQRGLGTADFPDSENCPTDAVVADLTAWHFVLGANTHDFASLDVAFTLDGTDVTVSALTPVAKPTDDAGWAAFDPDTQFIADPDGKHAYVYTDSASGLVRDAASQNSPDSAGPKFQLSHICANGGTGTDGTTDDTTTDDTTTTDGTTDDTTTTDGTTDDVLGTGTVNPTTGGDDPETEVKGNVVLPEQLPRTGDNDRSLFLIGMGLITIGAITMVVRRELHVRS